MSTPIETYCSYEIEEVSNANRIKEKNNEIYGLG